MQFCTTERPQLFEFGVATCGTLNLERQIVEHVGYRKCVRNLDLRVQVHPGELSVSKQQVHIILEAS